MICCIFQYQNSGGPVHFNNNNPALGVSETARVESVPFVGCPQPHSFPSMLTEDGNQYLPPWSMPNAPRQYVPTGPYSTPTITAHAQTLPLQVRLLGSKRLVTYRLIRAFFRPSASKMDAVIIDTSKYICYVIANTTCLPSVKQSQAGGTGVHFNNNFPLEEPKTAVRPESIADGMGPYSRPPMLRTESAMPVLPQTRSRDTTIPNLPSEPYLTATADDRPRVSLPRVSSLCAGPPAESCLFRSCLQLLLRLAITHMEAFSWRDKDRFLNHNPLRSVMPFIVLTLT